MPVSTPAEATSPPYMPCAASWESSRKGAPTSRSWRMRSRGSSLPRSVCLARARSPPPCSTAATLARRSETSPPMASAFRRNSADRGSTVLARALMAGPSSRPGCGSSGLLEELAPDEHAPDLAGAGADLVELGVPQQAAGGVVVDVPVPAQALDGVERHVGGPLRGVEDGPGRVLARGLPGGALPGHGVDVGTAGAQRGVHVRQLALDELELADGLAELLALVDVGHHHVEAGLHDAQRPAGQHGALVVQPAHEHVHAAPHLAHH